MQLKRVETESLKSLEVSAFCNTVFTTYPWLEFLRKNQKAEPVVLQLIDGEVVGYFVGLVIKKFGIKILGSPFEGWLTPDMGFIRIKDFDINEALELVKNYAFKTLKCMYVQITDKAIKTEELSPNHKYFKGRVLRIDNSLPEDEVLQGFTKNGRRDVRAFYRKGATIKQVPFDREFADLYYEQLIDVFRKQSRKPAYGKDKIYDLVDAFKDYPQSVLALVASDPEGTPIATVLSFGFGSWGYYLGAASFRQYQKLLPNEGLFWEFAKYWNRQDVDNLDLVGYREYKMKYNPEFMEVPVIYFERLRGLTKAKNTAKKIMLLLRKIKG